MATNQHHYHHHYRRGEVNPLLQGKKVMCLEGAKKTGYFIECNVKCDCCGEIFTPTKFEIHSGGSKRRPSEYIVVVDDNYTLEHYYHMMDRMDRHRRHERRAAERDTFKGNQPQRKRRHSQEDFVGPGSAGNSQEASDNYDPAYHKPILRPRGGNTNFAELSNEERLSRLLSMGQTSNNINLRPRAGESSIDPFLTEYESEMPHYRSQQMMGIHPHSNPQQQQQQSQYHSGSQQSLFSRDIRETFGYPNPNYIGTTSQMAQAQFALHNTNSANNAANNNGQFPYYLQETTTRSASPGLWTSRSEPDPSSVQIMRDSWEEEWRRRQYEEVYGQPQMQPSGSGHQNNNNNNGHHNMTNNPFMNGNPLEVAQTNNANNSNNNNNNNGSGLPAGGYAMFVGGNHVHTIPSPSLSPNNFANMYPNPLLMNTTYSPSIPYPNGYHINNNVPSPYSSGVNVPGFNNNNNNNNNGAGEEPISDDAWIDSIIDTDFKSPKSEQSSSSTFSPATINVM